MDTTTTTATTATGFDCLAELRKGGGGGFSWNGFSPSGGQLSTVDRNEDNQAQQWKPLCLVARNRRPRTKRCRRSAFTPRRSIPPLFEPKNSPNSRLIKQQRKKLKQLYPLNSMEKSNCSTKCTHCGVTDTPQWRAGPLGPRTLCNACGVRYKSGRLLPEYRPAASPYFSPTLHSNSHKKVLEMRNKPVNGPYMPVNGSHSHNSGTELAAEDIKCSEKVGNKLVVESYNEDTMTKVPVVPYVGSESPDNVVVPGGWESKEVVPYVGFLDSPDNVLQRRDDEEEFFENFLDGIEDNNSMDLIPNIDPLYGLDLGEFYLGDHSLDFDFTF